jgi:xylan 1,4-beta-xylosidase
MICHRFSHRGEALPPAAPLRPGHFRNPILAGAWPDPRICRVGADCDLVNSTFAWFPGLEILHSRNLVNWRHLGLRG